MVALAGCGTSKGPDWRKDTSSPFAKTPIKDLKKRAQQNDYFAMAHLGWRLDTGSGIEANPREAASWYRRAADLGRHSMAQNNLGCLYRDGRGVVQDHKMAATLYRAAAKQGNRHAKTNLGWLFERGFGVAVDYREAFRLYSEAAVEIKDPRNGKNIPGHPMAQNNLGVLHRDGKGTPEDPFPP